MLSSARRAGAGSRPNSMAETRPTLGLALGSGGARGWCHIGVLRELEVLGIRPDVISGASMGALVGAIHAGGALDALEDWARGLTSRSFFGLLDVRLSSGGLIEGSEILKVIRGLSMPVRIEDLPIPLAVVTTDMASGREVWLTEGDVAEAVRASAALPGIVSPFNRDGKWFLDGGLTNPVPVSACRVLGAEVVIAVNPNGRSNGTFWAERDEAPLAIFRGWRDRLPDVPSALSGIFGNRDEGRRPGYLDVLSAAIDIMTESIVRSRLAGDPPQLVLEAHLSRMSVLELHRADEAIAEGRRLVRDNAAALCQAAGIEKPQDGDGENDARSV